MDINCTEKELFILKRIGQAAQALHMPCYVIGGFVRDKLLHRKTKDLDIVCVGDGIALANRVGDLFHPRPKLSIFKTFGTAQLVVDGFEVEFVGARKESYQSHSRNPEVSPGTLTDDQNRRDFTINALAISLNREDFGKLLDPFDGVRHLSDNIIKRPLQPAENDARHTLCNTVEF
jgi:poly(A) polymerase